MTNHLVPPPSIEFSIWSDCHCMPPPTCNLHHHIMSSWTLWGPLWFTRKVKKNYINRKFSYGDTIHAFDSKECTIGKTEEFVLWVEFHRKNKWIAIHLSLFFTFMYTKNKKNAISSTILTPSYRWICFNLNLIIIFRIPVFFLFLRIKHPLL